MQIRNHIVYHFLNSPDMCIEASISDYKRENANPSDETVRLIRKICSIDNNKSYYVTNTITDKLSFLKVDTSKWDIFRGKEDAKYTFIFNDDSFLRMIIEDGDFLFYYAVRKSKGNVKASYFYHSYNDDKQSGDFAYKKDFFFKLLCFFFFSANEERIVNGGKSYGTKKQPDALSNDTNHPITIINSNWNITSIRDKGFNVSGHFRLQPCGVNHQERKMIFIDPFLKTGYIRRATNINHNI